MGFSPVPPTPVLLRFFDDRLPLGATFASAPRRTRFLVAYRLNALQGDDPVNRTVLEAPVP
ncbi:hypothetical protein SAMD00079811_72600 [Scytonema sp. HK-05]|nr:hypothetical protein SAMD00079811_72600 [Scytonema sp. HK-05]